MKEEEKGKVAKEVEELYREYPESYPELREGLTTFRKIEEELLEIKKLQENTGLPLYRTT